MSDLCSKIKLFSNGKISKRIIIKQLIEEYHIVNNERKKGKIEQLSHCESALVGIETLIKDLREGKYEKDRLKFCALSCDICNNLSHASIEGSEKDRELKGAKKVLVFEIIKECAKVGNKAYGLLEDRGIKAFAVDIPEIGQVKWHFPNHCEIRSKQYDFEIERGDVYVTNMDLLCQRIPHEKKEKLGKHNLLVINSNSLEEMNKKLYPKSKFEDTLKSMNNSENEIAHYYKKEYETPKLEIVHPEESEPGKNKSIY